MVKLGTVACVALGGMALMGTNASAYELSHVDLDTIDIGGEIGRRIDVTVKNNALVIDVDNDFLKPFQVKERNDGFIGLGMFIDALARLARHTGNADLIARKDYVIDAALAAQEEDGYLGMLREESRIKNLWDVHEMSYIVLGLTSDYELFGHERSLNAAKKLADYLVARLSKTPPPDVFNCDLSPAMPITGFADAFLYLSEQSGDPKYREFCLDVLHIDTWRKPIVKGRFGPIDGHVYAYLDKCLVQLRLDPEAKNRSLHEMGDGALDFMVHENGTAISGACGDHECWQDTQAGMCNLGETCASTYALKFYDELMRQAPDAVYGDLMERTIFNSLFGAQSPDGRWIRYYTPFEAPRVYFKGDTYCCPNNYRRGISDLPQYVVYRSAEGLVVNLYTACEVETTLADGASVRLRQDTDYPNSGRVAITVSAAGATFPLTLRIPRWCKAPSVKVNGEPTAEAPKPGSLFEIRRTWGENDVVELDMPMEWRLVRGRRSQVGRVAIMRGPQLFTLNPNRNEGIDEAAPRLMTLDPGSIKGPAADDTVRPGGLSCTVDVWDGGAWYPGGASRTLTLTEFADPDSVETYFHIPNPEDERCVDDELFAIRP